MNLLDEMIPLSKIAHLLRLADSADNLPFEFGDYVSDILDTLNYICKSENHVGRVALNNEIYRFIKKAIEKVKKGRYLVLHSAISLASSLLNDKTKRNFEIANDKWGCDMEGFLLLEKVRDKASRDVEGLFYSDPHIGRTLHFDRDQVLWSQDEASQGHERCFLDCRVLL